MPWEEASRYGVCDTNKYGEITDVIETPEDPPSNLVMTSFNIFTPAMFHAYHLVQPSTRGEYETSEAINLRSCKDRSDLTYLVVVGSLSSHRNCAVLFNCVLK